MGMTKNEAKLPKTQAATLAILGDVEMSETDWRLSGGNLQAIYALVRKGLVTKSARLTTDPRVLNGQEFTETYYRAA